MGKKRIIIGFIAIFLVMSIFVYGCGKTTISKGDLCYHKNLGMEIIPPAGWKILDMSNPLLDGLSFYPVNSKNVRLFITSKTKLAESRRPRSKRRMSLEDRIDEYRNKRKRLPESRFLNDKKVMLNSMPAHVIEISYMSDGVTPAEDKSFFLEYNNRFYMIGYWIFRDQDYHKNINLIQKSLKTLKFKK